MDTICEQDDLPTDDHEARNKALVEADGAGLCHKAFTATAAMAVNEIAGMTMDAAISMGLYERRLHGPRLESFKGTMAAVAYDVLVASGDVEADGYCFRSADWRGFKDTLAGERAFNVIRKVWPQIGLVEYVPGIRNRRGGRAPRFKATLEFMALFARHGITFANAKAHFKPGRLIDYPVVLGRGRNKEGKRRAKVELHRTEETDRIAAELHALNVHLVNQEFCPPIHPQFAAIFQDHDDAPGEAAWGGRLTDQDKGSFQGWPKAARLDMTINGEAPAELDLKGSHLTIFAGLHGVQVGPDPYVVPGLLSQEDRPLTKHLVTAMLGKGHTGFTRGWPDLDPSPKNADVLGLREGRKAQEVADLILEAIPVLQELPPSKRDLPGDWCNRMDWGVCQRIEAQILLETMSRLRVSGMTTLPIHNSLLVPASRIAEAHSVFRQVFIEITGVHPTMTLVQSGTPEATISMENPRTLRVA